MEEEYEIPDIDELEENELDLSFSEKMFDTSYHPIMDEVDRFPLKDAFKFGKKIEKVTTESFFVDSDDGITIKPEVANIRHYKLGKDCIKGEELVRLKFLGKYAFMEEKSEFVFSERLM